MSVCVCSRADESPDLHIDIHGQVVAVHPRALPPNVGGNGAEEAHAQLHGDDQGNLQVQEAIIGSCRHPQHVCHMSLSCAATVQLLCVKARASHPKAVAMITRQGIRTIQQAAGF